jgi:hypothetical protein
MEEGAEFVATKTAKLRPTQMLIHFLYFIPQSDIENI